MKTPDLIRSLSDDERPKASPSIARSLCLWILVAAFTAIVGLYFLGVREDLAQKLQNPMFLLEIVPPLILSLGSAYLAVVYGFPGEKAQLVSARRLFGILMLSLAFLSIVFLFEISRGLGSAFHVYWDIGAACLTGNLLIALPPTLLLILLLRRAAPVHPLKAGLFAAVSGGALAAVIVNLHCSVDQAFHHVLWTLIPFILLVMLGSYLGEKLLRW